MGLFSKKNIDKAKSLAEKNKNKIASSVHKATDAIDKKTGGKHADKLKKVDDAAQKFAGAEAGTAAESADAEGSDGGDSTPTTA